MTTPPAQASERERAEAAGRWPTTGGCSATRAGGGWTWIRSCPTPGRGSPLRRRLETMPLLEKPDASPLDGKPCHEVELRVVIEQRDAAGQLTERPVLKHVLRPAELAGQSIRLTHMPTKWPDNLDPLAADAAEQLKRAALAQAEWVPILSVGSKTGIYQGSFTDTGVVDEKVTLDPAKGIGRKIAKLDDVFDMPDPSKPAADPDAAAAKAGVLTAEWIEYEIRARVVPAHRAAAGVRRARPGRGPAAAAAAAPARRPPRSPSPSPARLERNLNLIGDTEILLVSSHLSEPFVAHLAARAPRWTTARRMKNLLAPQPGDDAGARVNDAAGKLVPGPGELHAFAVARGRANRLAGDVYYDQPNVFAAHRFVRVVDDGGGGGATSLVGCRRSTSSRTASPFAGADVDPFLARLEQGVWDTNAEALMLSGCGRLENTSEVFAAAGGGDAAEDGSRWRRPRTWPGSGPRTRATPSRASRPTSRPGSSSSRRSSRSPTRGAPWSRGGGSTRSRGSRSGWAIAGGRDCGRVDRCRPRGLQLRSDGLLRPGHRVGQDRGGVEGRRIRRLHRRRRPRGGQQPDRRRLVLGRPRGGRRRGNPRHPRRRRGAGRGIWWFHGELGQNLNLMHGDPVIPENSAASLPGDDAFA